MRVITTACFINGSVKGHDFSRAEKGQQDCWVLTPEGFTLPRETIYENALGESSIMRNPSHPGEIIQEFMEGLTVTGFAAHLKITRANLSRMIHGRTGVSAEMAVRLSEAFGTSPEVWIKLQANYDLSKAIRTRRVKIPRLAA